MGGQELTIRKRPFSPLSGDKSELKKKKKAESYCGFIHVLQIKGNERGVKAI